MLNANLWLAPQLRGDSGDIWWHGQEAPSDPSSEFSIPYSNSFWSVWYMDALSVICLCYGNLTLICTLLKLHKTNHFHTLTHNTCLWSGQKSLIFKNISLRGFWMTQWKRNNLKGNFCNQGLCPNTFSLNELNWKSLSIQTIQPAFLGISFCFTEHRHQMAVLQL